MESTAPNPSEEPATSGRLEILEEASWLRRFAQGLASSAEDAEDLTQDAMIAALGHGAPARNPRGFLSEIARRLAAQKRRKSRRRHEREVIHVRRMAEETGGSPDGPAAAANRSHDQGFEEAERVDTMRLVLEELRNLPAAQQRAITLAYMDELTPAEIAQRLGVSPATVRAHLSRGLAALRGRLDQRGGGRLHWLSALTPWLVPPGGSLGAVPATTLGKTAAKTAAGSLFPSSALLAIGTMKYFLAACVPALILGLWWSTGPGAGDVPKGPTREAARQVKTAQLPPAGPAPELDPVAQRTPLGEEEAAAPRAAPATPIATAGTRTLLLVDRLTGEPVPHMKVRTHTMAQFGQSGTELTSDSAGLVTLPPHDQGEPLMLSEHDQPGRPLAPLGMGAGGVRTGRVDLISPDAYKVEVGPTYRFRFPADLEERWSEFTPRLVAQGDSAPERSSVSVLREGDDPWVRFPFQATKVQPGPYRLRLEDREGLWLGQCAVESHVGVDPRTLTPTFEARGAVRFELEVEAPPVLTVSLSPVGFPGDPWVPLTVRIGRHGGGQRVHGVAGLLVPGSYRWALGDQDAGGQLTVEAGKTTTVVLGDNDLGATFDSHVLIDMSAHPEVHPSSWLTLVTKKDDGTVGFMASAQSTDKPHQYRIPLTALSHGTWLVNVHPSGDVRLAPRSVEVNPGSPPPTIRALPPIARETLTLTVQDASTGEPLTNGEGGFVLGLTDGGEFTRTADGALVNERVPTAESVELFVRAPGYAMLALPHQTARDGRTREVELRKGWRNRALVIGAANMKPIVGLELRAGARSLGKTPAGGWLWVEGELPSDPIEIVDPEGRYEVLNSPYDAPHEKGVALDPLEGWIFVVAEKGPWVPWGPLGGVELSGGGGGLGLGAWGLA